MRQDLPPCKLRGIRELCRQQHTGFILLDGNPLYLLGRPPVAQRLFNDLPVVASLL